MFTPIVLKHKVFIDNLGQYETFNEEWNWLNILSSYS